MTPTGTMRGAALVAAVVCGAVSPARGRADQWPRHTIDQSAVGADGVRLADVNGDGWPDIATGWEESGLVRIYLHPGADRVRRAWPGATVGIVKSPEDAVFADLDGDGTSDVVSSCEGRTQAIFVHWGPARLLDEGAWRTDELPAAAGRQWMMALPQQVDDRRGIDLIVGSKGNGAAVGWLESPPDPRRTADWRFHKLADAGWIMSLEPADLNGDGRTDLVVSDRKGPRAGVYWLEHPGPGAACDPWPERRLGATGREVMFLDVADVDGDGRADVVAAVKPHDVVVWVQPAEAGAAWSEHRVTLPSGELGTAKAVRAADLDGDGRIEIVFSCEHAQAPRRGVVSFPLELPPRGPPVLSDISGPEGVKFDHVKLLDLDRDGDLDVLTCEETARLGVVWYENPARSARDAN